MKNVTGLMTSVAGFLISGMNIGRLAFGGTRGDWTLEISWVVFHLALSAFCLGMFIYTNRKS